MTQQGDGGDLPDERVWVGFPELHWRHPIDGLKDGAEVLLTAEAAGEAQTPEGSAGLAVGTG